ncbi:MAG: 30S ribosome-binding factor RbfA [Planctomycetes bacterium]|nr:30S ribosome-binding factor RbfA [Planctomycetota bacterium]
MTRRTDRVSETVKHNVSNIILHKLYDPRLSLLTVTRVSVSPDLRNAKVYVTAHGDETAQKLSLQVLNHAKGHIQSEMARHLKLRNTPSLSFSLDNSEEMSNNILSLIEKAVKEDT